MAKLTVVSNSGPLIALSSIRQHRHIHHIPALLSDLEQNAFRMSAEVKTQILRKAGELK